MECERKENSNNYNYVLINSTVTHVLLGKRSCTGSDIGCDHNTLLTSKFAIATRRRKSEVKEKRKGKEMLREHLLAEDGTKYIYQARLDNYIHRRPIIRNINEEWKGIRSTVSTTAFEALGKRRKRNDRTKNMQ